MKIRLARPMGYLMALVAVSILHLLPQARAASPTGVSASRLLEATRILASDEFEGRAPGTAGEERTIAYLVNEFQKLGLEPGNPDGTFVQRVPMMGITSQARGSYAVGNQRGEFVTPSTCVLWSRRFVSEVQVQDSQVVFVGYGVVAPEYGWDDFKGVDVKGKTIVMLVGDPQVPDPLDPEQLDPRTFKGREMTYYGRWTYKYEIAAQKGAAAALIVHENEAAAYPFTVVINSNTGEKIELQSPTGNSELVAVEGWITKDQTQKLLGAAGYDYDALKKAACRPTFQPVPLGGKASFSVKNTLRELTSRNGIAKISGSDRKLRDEYVIYSAHWDHLGKDPSLTGDPVYHGALDNATGVAGLFEIAREFKKARKAPKRSLIFLAPTAEEKGLLGARYFTTHPLYPLARTVAVLNMDGLNPYGRTRDLTIVGHGNSTLEDLLQAAAAKQGRVTLPDPKPETGGYFRADHFEFAKCGIPSLYFHNGLDFLGQPKGYGEKKRDEYVQNDYHKVTDVVRPDWTLEGAVEDLDLMIAVGRTVANNREWPAWKPGSEFRAARPSPSGPKR